MTPDMLVQGQPKGCVSLTDHDLSPNVLRSPEILSTTFPLTIQKSTFPSVLKRHRLDTDVDGEDSVGLQRKKRRLRLHLVTSRLSRPYATPPTHILTRQSRRPGSWLRPRDRIRSPLRRAAILNAIRVKRTPAKSFGRKEANLLSGLRPPKEPIHTEVDLITQGIRIPRGPMPNGCLPQQYVPTSPSPLGPSNYYDALDDEDDPTEDDDPDDIEESGIVYSNFNDLDGADTENEDYETYDPFSGGEEHCRPWTPGPIGKPANISAGFDRVIEALSASYAS
ncbi:MAG: hypothetical protein L6R35_003160 [Caloplaca aegaea]|nr:MAG: hypothetical protein L6R35_003160 [Caloplaca aegaea]